MAVGRIDPQDLARDLATVQLVDVRYPNEWEAGHIDGALHIPQDYIFDRIGELDRATAVVTVCRSGSRSAEAAEDLDGEGFEVRDLRGGVLGWVAQGFPLVSTDGRSGSVAEPEPPPDSRPEEMQQLQSDFLDAIFAVKDHFGDREPSEEEILGFLRQRSIDQGKTPEEVDALLASMETGPTAATSPFAEPSSKES